MQSNLVFWRRALVGVLAAAVAFSPAAALAQRPAAPKAKAAPKPGKPAAPKTLAPKTPAKFKEEERAAAKPLDLKYVTARPLAAAIVHPQQLLALPRVQMLPLEVAQAQVLEKFGFDPWQIEELVVLAVVDFGRPPTVAFILRFKQPYDRDAVVAHLDPQAADAPDAAPLYRIRGPNDAPWVALPDDRTILAASPEELREMLSGKQAGSALLDRLRKLDAADAVSAVVALEPLRGPIQIGMTQLPPLPPPLQPFLEIPELLTAVETHVRVTPELETSIVLEGRDAAAAAKLNGLVDQAFALGNQFVDGQLAALAARQAPAAEQAMLRYAKRILATGDESIERRQQNERLALTMHGDAALMPATNGVLIALLLPAVQAAREAARRAQSMNNLKQIGLAMQSHADVFKMFPRSSYSEDGKPLLSWRVHILPFVEQNQLYKQFHLDEPWDSEHNKTLIAKLPAVYKNPSLDAAGGLAGMTNYLQPTGKFALFRQDKEPTFAMITDGTSNTIAAVESSRSVVWTRPDDLEFDPEKPLANLNMRPGGFLALFADGHVSFVPSTTSPETLANLFNPQDGNPTDTP